VLENEQTDQPVAKPRRKVWLTAWVREEAFWRDVTTRTLAILVSGLILYLLALLAGYVKRPDGLGVVVAVGSLLSFGITYFVLPRYMHDFSNMRRSNIAFFFYLVFLALGMGLLAMGLRVISPAH
jgi:hypothetical protein